MRYLNKVSVRVVVSLIAGGVINEELSLSSAPIASFTGVNDPVFTLIYASIIYLLLTGVVKGSRKKPQQQQLNRYVLDPEVPAELGEKTILDTSVHPPIVSRLHLIFKGWMGDDLLQNFPVFLVTKRLGNKLGKSNLTGFKLRECIIESSEEFEVFNPETKLPELSWLHISGTKDVSDFYVNDKNYLTVSENAFALLSKFNLKYCDVVKENQSPTGAKSSI